MQFVSAPLLTHTDASTFYGTATAHTVSLAGKVEFSQRAPEIKELARGLKNDPALIHEHIRAHVETEFVYGLQKGPLGALIDKSATPFDQAALLVEAVREGGGTARYAIGKLTLSAADFTAWTGASTLQTACRLLAAGGIPATFNGGATLPSDCSSTAPFTDVTLGHAWAEVQIGSEWRVYDPSLKFRPAPAILDLRSAAGLVAGAAASIADDGQITEAATNAIRKVNAGPGSGLETHLLARSDVLIDSLTASSFARSTDEILGIGSTASSVQPTATYVAERQLNEIPDKYRTKLDITVALAGSALGTPQAYTKPLYVDEIYGRRLELDSNFNYPENPGTNGIYNLLQVRLELDDVVLDSLTLQQQGDAISSRIGADANLTIAANHPYAALGGAYADETVTRRVRTTLPIAIVHGWGQVSSALGTKWGAEVAQDKALPTFASPPNPCNEPGDLCFSLSQPVTGAKTRQGIAASWLAQFSRMTEIQGALGGVALPHHHTIGFVYPVYTLDGWKRFPVWQTTNNPFYFGIREEYTSVSVESVLSAVPLGASSNRNAVARSVAVAASALEGSVLEQTQDLPDTASVASRFAWANKPEDDPCNSSNGERRFHAFAGTNAAFRSPLYVHDGLAFTASNTCRDQPFTIVTGQLTDWRTRLENGVNTFLGLGFQSVTTSAETFLGPGSRFGEEYADSSAPNDRKVSRQRGGAIVATRFSGADVVEVAHILSNHEGLVKGGGGKQPERAPTYDPTKAADVLKDRFVDRSVALGVDLRTGSAGYTSPVLLSVGSGELPFKLDVSLSHQNAHSGCTTAVCTGPVQGGWNHNWDVRFSTSGSGLEAMGQSSPLAAAGSLVAFMTMQDIFSTAGKSDLERDVYAALVADWWRRSMVSNVATVNQGFSARQYVRLTDGGSGGTPTLEDSAWLAPRDSPGTLDQIGVRTKVRDNCQAVTPGEPSLSTSRRWDQQGVTFTLTNAGGDVQRFEPWAWLYNAGVNNCEVAYGYKPTTWTWPQGGADPATSTVKLTFGYDYQQGVTSVTNSVGRTLTFTGGPRKTLSTLTASDGTRTVGVTDANAFNSYRDAANAVTRFDVGDVVAPLAGQAVRPRPRPYRSLLRLYAPHFDDPDTPALEQPQSGFAPSLEYTYDTLGRVKTAADATALQWGTRGAYEFLFGDGSRGERLDPRSRDPITGQEVAGPRSAYTVYFDSEGRAVRHVDELGRETRSEYDGRARVTQRTYPEGDRDAFGYDTRDNVTGLTRTPKPGSTLTPLTITAAYEPFWNKLAWIEDPKGRRTDFEYYATPTNIGGSLAGLPSLLREVRRPSVDGSRPTYQYRYEARGLLRWERDPTGVLTTRTYDGLGNVLSETTGSAAVGDQPALNLSTTYTYLTTGDRGDPIQVKNPRDRVTVYSYDPMRRRTQETRHDGEPTAAPLSATQWHYDASGQVRELWRATGFNANQTWVSGVAERTTYTPTGKTDSVSNHLTETTRTLYDALDRVSRVIDPTGRVTENRYDLAGQLTEERRGVGVPASEPGGEQAYARYTYTLNGKQETLKDARDHVVSFFYDGFDRLSRTRHPDGTEERAEYDRAGNVTDVINRGGFRIKREYDDLDRKRSEIGQTGGQPNRATRSWDIADRAFTYDAAGRMTSAVTTVPGSNPIQTEWSHTFAYDAAGRLIRHVDNLGTWDFGWTRNGQVNFQRYADGTEVTNTYDGLDRLSEARFKRLGESGTSRAALIAWDARSRRDLMTFGDGTTQDYVHDDADRITSIAHVFGSAADVTFGYTYDAAGRQVTRTVSNPDYVRQQQNPQTYGAADETNQYASAHGSVMTWWDEGPLDTWSGRQQRYDEESRLATVLNVSNPANRVSFDRDALGQTWRRERANTSGVTGGARHGRDGLRPEIALEEVFGTAGAALGTRRYVLGPGPDERLAFLNVDHTWFPHTDRQGTTIALSRQGEPAVKFAYDAWGAPQNNAVEEGVGAKAYPFRYTGQALDPWTEFYDYKARTYAPSLGRFLQPDPIGFEDGPNLYTYVHNDPGNNIDINGEIAFGVASKIVKVAIKGGDIGATLAGAAADVRTLTSGSTTLGQRAGALVSLASEIASPVSVRDAKAGVAAAKAAADRGGGRIFRFGTQSESPGRLDRRSKEAEAAGFRHGVSGSKSDLGPTASSASRTDLEASGFRVQDTPTKRNPDHVTIELPDPVTKTDADRFNSCFGRDKC